MSRLNCLKAQYNNALPVCRALMLSAASLLVLSGCGGDNGGTVTTSGPNSNSAPVVAADEGVTALPPAGSSQMADASAPKAADAIAPLETIAPIPTPMETFRALAPEQGLKITPLFVSPVSDESARIKRVEDAVQGMHNDFETIMPTMVRMASMEKDMRGLIQKLQTITGEVPPEESPVINNPNQAEGEPMPLTQELVDPLARTSVDEVDWTTIDDIAAQQQAAHGAVTVTKTETTTVTTKAEPAPVATPMAPPQIEGAAEVQAIRIADHTDSTRIVLDMSAKAAIPPANFQNDGKQVVLDLPQINWTAKTESALKNSALVSGYKYENGKLILTLNRAAEIKGQQSLPPEGSSGYRFVLDLKARA